MIINIVRKPLVNNVCENIELHNTGGLNIRASRHLVGELKENPTCEQHFGRLPANVVLLYGR